MSSKTISLQSRRKRQQLSEYWLWKYGTASGAELVQLLQEHGFVSSKIDPSHLAARWTPRNTIELWYRGDKLEGAVGFEKGNRLMELGS